MAALGPEPYRHAQPVTFGAQCGARSHFASETQNCLKTVPKCNSAIFKVNQEVFAW